MSDDPPDFDRWRGVTRAEIAAALASERDRRTREAGPRAAPGPIAPRANDLFGHEHPLKKRRIA